MSLKGKVLWFLSIVFCATTSALGQTPSSTTSAPCPDPTVRSLHFAEWIWTTEINTSLDLAPIGSRAFRFKPNLPFPPGQQAFAATITIAADDEYELYVQGTFIGSGSTFSEAQVFFVTLPEATDTLVVAVNATNTGGEAGLIATVQLELQCGSLETIPSAGGRSWRFSTEFAEGWQDPAFDDSAWSFVFDEGPYGIQPWGDIIIPPASTPPSFDLRELGFVEG